MPQIIPLRGLRYTPAAGPLGELLAPPYDVITPAQQQALLSRNPFNAVHLELAEGGEERYARVAGLVDAWERGGQLARETNPTLYAYEQTFREAGRTFTRRALVAGVEAQPWDEGAVRPHEFTMSGPKEDRLKLLEATRIQFSPVFMIARDRAGQLQDFLELTMHARPADLEANTPDGDGHRLWLVEASRFEMRQLAPLLSESFYIADGHHRYETAVNYRERLLARGEPLERDHPARFAMTAIVAASDPGLVIRPIHRMVPRSAPPDWEARIATAFAVERLGAQPAPAAVATAVLEREPGAIVAIGLAPGELHVLRLRERAALQARIPAGRSERWAAISPNVLRYGVLEPLWGITDVDLTAGTVEYSHDAQEVVSTAQAAQGGTVCFLISHVGIDEVMALADQGERMPQKSTFFHPKLGTGLVFHPLYP
jgi:uncharacterized protein (DUF1015 family)